MSRTSTAIRLALFYAAVFVAVGIHVPFWPLWLKDRGLSATEIGLLVAAAYLINWNGDGLALQWAFLIVTGFYLLLAVIFVIVGIRMVKRVRAPEKAIRQGKEIPKALRGKA